MRYEKTQRKKKEGQNILEQQIWINVRFKFLLSKENLVGMKQKFGFIEKVEKARIKTMKGLEC